MLIVVDKGFMKLINYFDPRYEMIAWSTIRDIRLPALYNEKKVHLKQGLAAASSGAITTDHWIPAATNNYTTITSHYIDPE